MEEGLRKQVAITEVEVVPKDERLSKSKDQQLIWKSTIQVTITFLEEVFKHGKIFHVAENGSTPSGPVSDKTATGPGYFYLVTRDDTAEEIDPRVFIDP